MRRACCVVSGGVYENVLFFPVVQMLKDRYPGVVVDVVTSARGKQVYEMCKNVRYATVYDPDDDWPEPAEYTHQLGILKVHLLLLGLCCNWVLFIHGVCTVRKCSIICCNYDQLATELMTDCE